SLEIEVDVNEAYIDRVSQGQQVAAVLDAYPDWRIPARVIAVVPAADRQKATVRVRVGLLERDPRILPDMGVSVRFLDSSTDDAPGESGPAAGATVLRVPASAVIRRDGRDVVFVVEDGRVERRAVRLAGRDDAGTVRIAAGLARSDRIIVDAADHELADGDRVRLAED
ncbi:MAG: efflux RND transporter periplasmic adaptor subunit, partial [Wenzhouxiangellaceae bacterium]|nr:efflux RND transporter periplasmic adaptor subunit [Wenzhouxiangellaceae bacterium]